ncbi:Ig-like domain-containing protein [Methylobacterium sp. HMF5984]|uniref:Ig-like domain-containing protein n=1 Tax=Methylobacterium sp. HMF5984 TaxID=3367370 RepID=UPI003854CE3E
MTQTGVYVGTNPADFASYSKWVGSTPGNVLTYLNNDSWKAFDSSIGWATSLWKNTAASNIWSVPLTVWGTSLEQVATGDFNDHFLKAAQALAQTKASSDGNIYVRVGWEFNGSWMPWAANGHEAAFIKSFQNLVDTFRSVSDKFKFVWDTTNDGGNMNPEKAYPGDKYVDVIGTDVYYSTQWDGTDAAKGFKGEVTRAYGLQWQQDFAAAHGKATAISEWGVASDNAAPYVQAMTKWMADHNMVYENYWDSNADYSGKLSTGANATAGAAYKSAISSLQGAATSSPLTAPTVAITSSGGLTNTLAVKLAGTVGLSDAGTTVHVLDGATEIGTALVQADGKWSANVSLLNQQGTHQITTSDTNAAGTGKSSSISYTVDTIAPLLSVSESVSGLTNKTSNTVTVKGSDSIFGMRSVEIYDNGRDLGAATQSSNGSWVFTAAKLTDGTHNFTAVAIDNAGNKSGAVSAGNRMVVDTVAPLVKLGLVQDTGTSGTDKITTNPALTGTAEAGAKVTLSEGTTTLGSVIADSTGHWNFTPTSLKLGAHTILASQTDAAGNIGSDTFAFNLQNSTPASTSVTHTVAQGYEVVTTEANRVVTDSFDFNWQRTGAEIVTKDAPGKTINQHFDRNYQQTSAEVTEVTQDGNRILKGFYDNAWNFTHAEIDTHNISGQSFGSTHEVFDANWHETTWVAYTGNHLDGNIIG